MSLLILGLILFLLPHSVHIVASSSALSALVVVAGLVLWVMIAFGAHRWLAGVGPFG